MTSDLTTGFLSLSVAIFLGLGTVPAHQTPYQDFLFLSRVPGFFHQKWDLGLRRAGRGRLVRGTEAVRLPGGLGKGKDKH